MQTVPIEDDADNGMGKTAPRQTIQEALWKPGEKGVLLEQGILRCACNICLLANVHVEQGEAEWCSNRQCRPEKEYLFPQKQTASLWILPRHLFGNHSEKPRIPYSLLCSIQTIKLFFSSYQSRQGILLGSSCWKRHVHTLPYSLSQAEMHYRTRLLWAPRKISWTLHHTCKQTH